jgi:hypothetical protein
VPRTLSDCISQDKRSAQTPIGAPFLITVYHPTLLTVSLVLSGTRPLLERISAHRASAPLPNKPSRLTPSQSLLDRISEQNPLPLHKQLALPSFQKSPIDTTATLETCIKATQTRYQAIFERRKLFDDLPPLKKEHLHQLATYLKWIDNNVNVIATAFLPAPQAQIFLGLTKCANINCTQLTRNYCRITDKFEQVVVARYFNSCKGHEHWD